MTAQARKTQLCNYEKRPITRRRTGTVRRGERRDDLLGCLDHMLGLDQVGAQAGRDSQGMIGEGIDAA